MVTCAGMVASIACTVTVTMAFLNDLLRVIVPVAASIEMPAGVPVASEYFMAGTISALPKTVASAARSAVTLHFELLAAAA